MTVTFEDNVMVIVLNNTRLTALLVPKICELNLLNL